MEWKSALQKSSTGTMNILCETFDENENYIGANIVTVTVRIINPNEPLNANDDDAIRLFDAREEKFNHNGKGILMPTECIVSEQANGYWRCKLIVIIDNKGRWEQIKQYDLISVPVPAMDIRLQIGSGQWQSKLRNQIFRIKDIDIDAKKGTLTASADHIFFDIAGNIIEDEEWKDISNAEIISKIASIAQGYNFETDIGNIISVKYGRKNIVQALVDPDEGLVSKTSGKLMRDNKNIYLVENTEIDRNVTIRREKNARNITVNTNYESVITSILAYGNEVNDKPIMLPEKWIDSPRIKDYPIVMRQAREYDAKTVDELRKKAKEDFEKGIDLPKIEVSVDYPHLRGLQNMFLFDTVTVIDESINLKTKLQMISYEFDAINRRYKSLKFGAINDIHSPVMGGYSISNTSLSGMKLNVGAVDRSRIQNLAVTGAKIALAAIDTAHIKDAAIQNAKIADATITSAKIGIGEIKNANIENLAVDSTKIKDGAINNAKIQNAAITSVKIAEGEIKAANIEDAGITSAKIKDGAITNAKISELAVDSANIRDGAINSAKIKDAAITSAKIARLAVDTANIAIGAIKQALIADGAVGSAQIADASITDAKIVELTANKITAGVLEVARLVITGENSIVQAINGENNTSEKSSSTIDGKAITKRSITADNIVAASITGKEIAGNTITANNILANTITGAQIKGDTIESRHLKAGAITADKLESNIGAGLDISSNVSIINKVSTSDLNSRIGTITEQTMSYIQQEVKTLASDIDVNADALEAYKKEVRVWQRFSEQGLELGRSDSPFSVLLSAQRLSFRQNGAEIAYLANNKLYVLQGEFSNLLTISDSEDGYYDLVVKNKGLTLKLRG